MAIDLDRFLREYRPLWDEPVMTLATSSPTGEPHAAAVYFVAQKQDQKLHLFFFSDPQSHHSQDLHTNANAAAEIHPDGGDWRTIHGLQLHGLVTRLVRGPIWDAAWNLYTAKFPFVKFLRPIVARNALYSFNTTWLRLIDNRRGFGFKEEWQLQ
jgi:uncharacterized protein YhbP (UPF0306 family)